jgi:hypothetical protein
MENDETPGKIGPIFVAWPRYFSNLGIPSISVTIECKLR